MKEKKRRRRRKKSPDASEGEESKESNAKLKAVSKALETAPNPGGRKTCHENQSKGRYDSQLVKRFSLFLYPQSIRKQHFDSLTTVVSACFPSFPSVVLSDDATCPFFTTAASGFWRFPRRRKSLQFTFKCELPEKSSLKRMKKKGQKKRMLLQKYKILTFLKFI